jgi:hypothetical protein
VTGVAEQQFSGFRLEAHHCGGGVPTCFAPAPKSNVELTHQHGLLPIVDVLAQYGVQVLHTRTGTAAVACRTRQGNAREHLVTADREVINVPSG